MWTILRVLALAGSCAQLASGGIMTFLRGSEADLVGPSLSTAPVMPYLEAEDASASHQNSGELCSVGESCVPMGDCLSEGEHLKPVTF